MVRIEIIDIFEGLGLERAHVPRQRARTIIIMDGRILTGHDEGMTNEFGWTRRGRLGSILESVAGLERLGRSVGTDLSRDPTASAGRIGV
jgi:hypothetical protein